MRLFAEPSHAITDPYLARAHELAQQGLGTTHPNPMVGCVVVRDDSIVGEGYHRKAGEQHAEVVALEAAGSWAQGATAYVTLEPCNHHGKTPPCTQALLAAGVDRVIIGAPDPNPDVSGGGAQALRDAGLHVQFSEDPRPFLSLNEDWFHWLESGRPWVTVKTALSLDGHGSSALDVRTRISGPECRSLTMSLRRRASAVAVGGHTALVDAPQLDLDDDGPRVEDAQPQRLVFTRGTATSPGAIAARLGEDSDRSWSIVAPGMAFSPTASVPQNVGFIAYDRTLGLAGALSALAKRGIVHLLVEAGPGLLTSLTDERLVDELVIYHAGGFLGPDAPPFYRSGGNRADSEMSSIYTVRETGIAGADAVTVWRPSPKTAA